MIDPKLEAVVRSEILTQEDSILLSENIKRFANLNFQKTKVEGLASEGLDQEFFNLVEKLKTEASFPATAGEQSALLRSIEEYLKTLPSVHLTIAFHPSREFLKHLASFFNNLEKKVLLDVYVNPQIVGGVVFEYLGNYRDYSLSRELDSLGKDSTFLASLLSEQKN